MLKFSSMPSLVRTRVLLTAFSAIVVIIGAVAVILFAKGYRPNFNQKEISPNGLLVAQSYPDGASIYLNSQLKSATDTSLTLSPGNYTVEIKKDGFSSWKKSLVVEAEIVTRATAWLFPSVPSLKAITSSGAQTPVPSPDGSKVAFIQPAKPLPDQTLPQLMVLDLSESPLGLINRDPKSLAPLPALSPSAGYHLIWSPDSRQILAVSSASAQLVDLSPAKTTPATDRITTLLNSWQQDQSQKETQKFASLPLQLQNILATSAAQLIWSPKENRLLYTATASAAIPDRLISPLPGSSTQPQTRQLTPGHIYVYDLEEDRNFLVDTTTLPSPSPLPHLQITPTLTLPLKNTGWLWFPTSHHLYKVENNRITIKEYDNTNPTVVYSGPMSGSFATAYPSSKQLLILANLNPDPSPLPNLYALSLR